METTIEEKGDNNFIKHRRFRNLQISYNMNTNKINLTFLAKFISEKYNISVNLYAYLNTREFKTTLYMIDPDSAFENFVYLLKFPEEHKCKIGSTHDITKKHKSDILRENIVAVAPVSNDIDVENKLKEELKKTHQQIKGTEDYFYYTSIDDVLAIFDKVISHNKIAISCTTSPLLDFSRTKDHYFKGIYGYSPIAEIVIKKFVRNDTDIQNWKYMLTVHDREIPNTSLNIMKDYENHHDYYFWFYYGYLFICDSMKPFFNASRIVNSMSKTNKSEHRLNHFLKENVHFKIIREQFIKEFGFDGVEDRTKISEPKLKGIYVHEYLIDSIIRWVSPSFEIMTNMMNRELAKIIDSSAPAEEKIRKIENILKIKTLSDLKEVKLRIPRSQFKINDYIDDDALAMFGGGKTKEELNQKIICLED